MASVPSTVAPNGQIIMGITPMYIPPHQNVEGGIQNAAAAKTLVQQTKAAEIAKSLGAGQKGSSRRRRGGAVNAAPMNVPTANSIPGVSATQNHIDGVNNLNQIRADRAYDGLINATPRQVAGFRFRDESKYGAKRKTIKRVGKKHGRRSNRTHRRKHRKSSHSNRRSNRIV